MIPAFIHKGSRLIGEIGAQGTVHAEARHAVIYNLQ